MIIGGFQRFSLIDYPDKICAIVFTQGCNFRCPYCHNPELVEIKRYAPAGLKEEEILSFLDRRKGKLDAVTITGGEPLLQSDLELFLSAVKGLGYLVKLDTNGSFPLRLEEIIRSKFIDYIAMDIKTSPDKYNQLINRKIEKTKIIDSIRLIMDSGLDYEFRTTVMGALFKKDDFYKIGKLIKDARLYILQRFVPSKTLDDQFLDMRGCSDEEIYTYREIMEGFVQRCVVR
ncbi:MAG: anaerobic ribonucleoside-triphosphate reductase activating protein [Deltaproteobacteria bacterium]|nr:anaerobic ribonucleoside-triphosphate reductase activating protein [Deltaproteobacteria bacterium]